METPFALRSPLQLGILVSITILAGLVGQSKPMALALKRAPSPETWWTDLHAARRYAAEHDRPLCVVFRCES